MKLTVWAGDACIFRRIRISLTAPPFVNASRDIFWYLRSSWICFTGNSLPASALWRVLQRSFPPSARCAALSNLFSKSISPCSFLLSPRNEQFENRRTCSFVEPIFNFLKLDRVEDIGGGTCNDISTRVIKRRVFKHTNENKFENEFGFEMFDRGSFRAINSIILIKFLRNFGAEEDFSKRKGNGRRWKSTGVGQIE